MLGPRRNRRQLRLAEVDVGDNVQIFEQHIQRFAVREHRAEVVIHAQPRHAARIRERFGTGVAEIRAVYGRIRLQCDDNAVLPGIGADFGKKAQRILRAHALGMCIPDMRISGMHIPGTRAFGTHALRHAALARVAEHKARTAHGRGKIHRAAGIFRQKRRAARIENILRAAEPDALHRGDAKPILPFQPRRLARGRLRFKIGPFAHKAGGGDLQPRKTERLQRRVYGFIVLRLPADVAGGKPVLVHVPCSPFRFSRFTFPNFPGLPL